MYQISVMIGMKRDGETIIQIIMSRKKLVT